MRSPAVLPKSVLLVEIIGIVLLTLAWLSLNQYLQLPAPFSSPTAAMLMIALMWRMARIVAPQLTHTPKPTSSPDREKQDDADH